MRKHQLLTKRRHRKVAIIHKYIPHYRQRFFELLNFCLSEKGIELIVIYGQPGSEDAQKKDAIELPWGRRIENKIVRFGKKEFYWQPVFPFLQNVDLVIVEQASKLLVNYLLIFQNYLIIRKVAFWGHGRSFQKGSASALGEIIKRFISTKVHWWFAYNELSFRIIESLGFPRERITIFYNAIDTSELSITLSNQKPEKLAILRQDLGIKSKQVGLYVGGMYADKRLDFLLDACILVHEQLPDFEMIFIGSGKEVEKVKRAASEYEWIHYIGPKFGADRVPYFALSKVFLMPGSVGLAVLDCFALEVPLITIQDNAHGPEIEYLKNEVNGILVESDHDPRVYASAVLSVLLDDELHSRLIKGCRDSRQNYTVEEMVKRFADGIEKALFD